jgi:hypothetical protein
MSINIKYDLNVMGVMSLLNHFVGLENFYLLLNLINFSLKYHILLLFVLQIVEHKVTLHRKFPLLVKMF